MYGVTRGKFREITVINQVIHTLGTMNACTKFHGDPSIGSAK